MSLQDLVIDSEQISSELIENLLKGRVELIQEGKRINLTKDGVNLSNKGRILLFLAGGKAWNLLSGEDWTTSPGKMQEHLGIQGNTLRPLLKELADNFLVKSEKGKYQVLSKGIYELESILETKIDHQHHGSQNNEGSIKKTAARKISTGPSKSKAIEELINEGYFSEPRELGDIQNELGRRAIPVKLTSLPSYILPLVRKRILSREQKNKGKGTIWMYKHQK